MQYAHYGQTIHRTSLSRRSINFSMQTLIQDLVDSAVADEIELGIQVAAYIDGRLVANAWAGTLDESSGELVDESTLFPVFSATKAMTATVIHRLAARGILDYEQPIVEFWPEFGANGKEKIKISQALNHTAGLSLMPVGIGHAELSDWDTMCESIAAMAPSSAPGSRNEYHAVTYSWVVGEVACRATGKRFPEMFDEEIRRPLNVEAMYIGIPDKVDQRVATLYEPGALPFEDDGTPQSIPTFIRPLHTWMNRKDARQACLPASNGIMSALAIARHYAALLPGGVDGVELLPEWIVRRATEVQKPEFAENDDYPKNWGLGYQLGGNGSVYGGESAFGHAGYGGSIGFADPELGLAVGVTRNLFQPNDSIESIVNAIRRHARASKK